MPPCQTVSGYQLPKLTRSRWSMMGRWRWSCSMPCTQHSSATRQKGAFQGVIWVHAILLARVWPCAGHELPSAASLKARQSGMSRPRKQQHDLLTCLCGEVAVLG